MNDTAADLEQLYRDLAPFVWSYVRRRIADRDDADEILQDTFLIVARRPEDLARAHSKRAWLLGIARNLVLERVRRRRTKSRVPLPCEPPAPEHEPEDPRLESVRNAVGRLPDHQREVIELRVEQELSYAEIAVTLAIPIGTVRSRLHNAVITLRETLCHDSEARLIGG